MMLVKIVTGLSFTVVSAQTSGTLSREPCDAGVRPTQEACIQGSWNIGEKNYLAGSTIPVCYDGTVYDFSADGRSRQANIDAGKVVYGSPEGASRTFGKNLRLDYDENGLLKLDSNGPVFANPEVQVPYNSSRHEGHFPLHCVVMDDFIYLSYCNNPATFGDEVDAPRYVCHEADEISATMATSLGSGASEPQYTQIGEGICNDGAGWINMTELEPYRDDGWLQNMTGKTGTFWYEHTGLSSGVAFVQNVTICGKICHAVSQCNYFSVSTNQPWYACFVHRDCTSTLEQGVYGNYIRYEMMN